MWVAVAPLTTTTELLHKSTRELDLVLLALWGKSTRNFVRVAMCAYTHPRIDQLAQSSLVQIEFVPTWRCASKCEIQQGIENRTPLLSRKHPIEQVLHKFRRLV